MRINQISTQVRSIHLNRHQHGTHDYLPTTRTKIRHIPLQEPVSDRASNDKIIETGMVQSNLDLRDQFLLAVLARLVQSVGLDHGIQLRGSGHDSRDRSNDTEEIGGVAEDGEGAEVVVVAGEEGVAGQVEDAAVDEVEDVGQREEGEGEVDGGWVDGMAVLAEFTKANYLEASLYKARHVEVFIVSLLVAEAWGFLRDISFGN